MTSDSERTEIAVYQRQYEASRSRLKEQRDSLKTFATEGERIFRLVLVILTAPATILGVLQPDSASRFIDYVSGGATAITWGEVGLSAGALAILAVGFTLLGGVQHLRATGFDAFAPRKSTNPNDLYISLSDEQSEREFLIKSIQMNLKRIDENDRTLSRIDTILGRGKGYLLFGVTSGVVVGLSYVLNGPIHYLWLVAFSVPILLDMGFLPSSFAESDAGLLYKALKRPKQALRSGRSFVGALYQEPWSTIKSIPDRLYSTPYPSDYEDYLDEITETRVEAVPRESDDRTQELED